MAEKKEGEKRMWCDVMRYAILCVCTDLDFLFLFAYGLLYLFLLFRRNMKMAEYDTMMVMGGN